MRPLIRRNKVGVSDKVLPVIAMAAFFFLALQGEALCQIRKFTPTITNFFGTAELNATYESIKNTFQGNGRETTDTTFDEKVTLGFSGFVYHPRFLVFTLSVGAGLREEYFKGAGNDGWNTGTIKEYEFKFLLLPRHTYSLEFYTRRRNPFIRGLLSPGLNPVIYQTGVNAYYKTRPLFLNLGYSFESIKTGGDSTDNNTVRLGGSNIIGPFSTSASLTHSKTTSTTLYDFTTDSAYLDNQFRKDVYYLKSSVGFQKLDQTSPTLSFTDKTINWTEHFNVDIFKSLAGNADFSYYKFDRTGEGEPTSNKTMSAGGGLVHRLYESLTTGYSIWYTKNDSGPFSSKLLSNTVRLNYRKNIPYGVLYSDFSARLTHTDRTGPLRIVNEPHEAVLFPPGNSFTLDEPDVDQTSITVDIVEPGTGILYTLAEGVNYTVESAGNQTVITIISVEGISPLIVGNGPFSFVVDYTLEGGATEFKTNYYTFSLRSDLFNHFISPRYGYTQTKQTVISGELPGGPEDATSNAFGITINYKAFSVSADYVIVDSRNYPQKRFIGTAEYREAVSSKVTLDVKAAYQKTRYEVGSGDVGTTSPYDETIYTLNSRANMVFPKPNITMYVGNNLSYVQGTSNSYGIGLNSGFLWRIGLLRVNAGLSVSHLVSELPMGNQVTDDRYFFLRATRDLF